MVVAGLTTGFDVACNGPDATDRLPGGVSSARLASVALGPAGVGAIVLVDGSVVVVSSVNATGYFTAQPGGATGLPPSSKYTTSCIVDVDGDGAVDVVLGAAPGNTSGLLVGSVGGGFAVVSGGLAATLAAALGTQGVSAATAVTLGPTCPPGVSLVAATPGSLVLVRLTSNGTAIANASVISGGGGGGLAGVAVGELNGDGVLDAVTCSGATNALYLVSGLCQPGAVLASTATLPGPCSGIGLGDVNGDGALDVFVSGASGVNNSLWLGPWRPGDGQGQVAAATGVDLGVGPVAPVFHDVNRCGCGADPVLLGACLTSTQGMLLEDLDTLCPSSFLPCGFATRCAGMAGWMCLPQVF